MTTEVYRGSPPPDPDAEFRDLPDPRTGLDAMLNVLLREGGSDLHLQADEPPRFRRDGDLVPIPHPRDSSSIWPPLSRTTAVRIVEMLLSGQEAQWFERANAVARTRLDRGRASEAHLQEVLDRHREQGAETGADPAGFDVDTAYALGDLARFRVNISLERNNPRVVMRRIPTKILGMRELGLPETLDELCTLPRGLVLVTGPTGSGKSTTLAAMVDEINSTQAKSILTIEDPIEFVHHSKRAMVSQREVGEDTPSFAESLKRALRQDPDVILVGELRDLETMRIALEAAETGHLVFGTLHTKSAKDTLTRIVNQYTPDEQSQVKQTLAGSLRAVIGQTLVKRRGGGRVAALEIMKVNDAIRSQLRSQSGFEQIDDTIRGTKDLGNQLLDDHLYQLVLDRVIEPAEAVRAATNRIALLGRMRSSGYAPAA